MLLTKSDFLAYFDPPPSINKGIMIGYAKPIRLSVYTPKESNDIRNTHIREITDYFNKLLRTDRYEILSKIYDSYLIGDMDIDKDWSEPLFDLRNSIGKSGCHISLACGNRKPKRFIRNLYHLEILRDTSVSMASKPDFTFWKALDSLFNKLVIPARLFSPSSIGLLLKGTPVLYLLQMYYPKASIMNPNFIKDILLSLETKRLFTPVLSWSVPALAGIKAGVQYYEGVDVMSRQVTKTEWLLSKYGDMDSTISRCRSEKYQTSNTFDTVIWCPPYYRYELYDSAEQSTSVYGSYADWINGYFKPTFRLCVSVLESGGFLIIIVNNYSVFELSELVDSVYMETDNITLDLKASPDNRKSACRSAKKRRTEYLFLFRKK